MDMNRNALINDAELENEDLIRLLEDKVEYCMENDKSIVIDISNPIIGGCFHTIRPEDYIVNGNDFYLVAGDFELHISLEKMKSIEYDDALDERFELKFDGIEIGLEFLL